MSLSCVGGIGGGSLKLELVLNRNVWFPHNAETKLDLHQTFHHFLYGKYCQKMSGGKFRAKGYK